MVDEVKTTKGVSFFGLLTLIFITLKLTKQIDWSWWYILAPLWIPVAIFLGVAFLTIILYMVFN